MKERERNITVKELYNKIDRIREKYAAHKNKTEFDALFDKSYDIDYLKNFSDWNERQNELFGFSSKEIVKVKGWARSIRDSRAFGFIDLYDGSCFKTVQVVFEREKIGNYDEIASQNVGAALIVTGKLELTPGAKQIGRASCRERVSVAV